MHIRDLVFSANIEALDTVLTTDSSLANKPISLPDNPATAHPLHRICDAVFNGQITESTGLEMAKCFVKHGSDVNTIGEIGSDSPLTAACSLGCDDLAVYYIDIGARIDHQGCHGGTALHWACWCGRDVVVKKLLTMDVNINQRCIDFKSTPLFWACHGFRFAGNNDLHHHQRECARLLLEHGADPLIPNFEGYLPKQLIADDADFSLLFSS